MNVGVIGSGSIGPDLAYGFLSALAGAGGKVFLHDIRQDALDKGMARIETYMRKAVARGKLSASKVDRMRGQIVATLEIGDLAKCEYVLEAATEDLKTKKAILAKLEGVVSEDCLIGFATSGIPRARIVEGTKVPARCFVNHPFFPAWRSPPVEVVLSGDEAFGTRMISTLKRLGKVPIVTADAPCFAADDIFVNYCAEAARIVAEGLATPAQVDKVVDEAVGGGGPFNVMDLTRGNLLNVHCLELMRDAPTGSKWFEPPPIFLKQANDAWFPPGVARRASCDEDVAKVIRDRIVAVLVSRTYFVVENGICDASDLDWLTHNALGFRTGLLEFTESLGGAQARQVCADYAAKHPGFDVPVGLAEGKLVTYYRDVVVTREDDVAIVRVRRPEARNALCARAMKEIAEAMRVLEKDDAVRGIVFSSYDGALAGADIKELAVLPDAKACEESCLNGYKVLDVIANLSKPVVAAVDGPVMGGGAETCMACHARVVGPNLMLAQPEVNLGIIPGYGGTQRLPRLIGAERAVEMLRTAKAIGAKDAYEWGWAQVPPAPDPVEAAKKLLGSVFAGDRKVAPVDPSPVEVPAKLAPVDLAHRSLAIDEIIVDVVRRGLALPLEQGLKVEADGFARCKNTVDMDIGMKNFMQNGPRVPAAFLHE
jgi:enoyl-CoA hydratase / 3-hydroxyacyl-CoA dehydrogenase